MKAPRLSNQASIGASAGQAAVGDFSCYAPKTRPPSAVWMEPVRIASLLLALSLLCACVSRAPSTTAASPSKVGASSARVAEKRRLASAPAEPARLPQEDVPLAFDRGLFHLDGTLTLPARGEGERVPAVVIVHGSGPMSRDGVMRGQLGLGFGFDLPVYKLLAEAMAARGYAVYRYNKRTCGSFNDCAETDHSAIPYSLVEIVFTTGEYVGDAEAALDAVAKHPAVDPERTFFVGHSEGGGLVPALLASHPRVRAGVMLAPPFHTMAVVLEQQSEKLRWSLATAGQPERAAVEGGQLLDAARALRRVELGTHLGAPILGQPPGLWASWLDLASRAPEIARRLDRPLLILGGSYDYNVAPSEIESWARWLEGSSSAPHRVKVLDCVTHALNCVAEPDPLRIKPADVGRGLSPELVREVADFLDAQRQRGAPPQSNALGGSPAR